MQDNSEVLSGLVVGHKRDGRRQYDPEVKRELVRQCMRPGVSVARMAMQHGINANLLRLWIVKLQGPSVISAQSGTHAPELDISDAFVPVQMQAPIASPTQTMPASRLLAQASQATKASTCIHVRLPNGVEIDLGEARLDDLKGVMQMLSALPCSN